MKIRYTKSYTEAVAKAINQKLFSESESMSFDRIEEIRSEIRKTKRARTAHAKLFYIPAQG